MFILLIKHIYYDSFLFYNLLVIYIYIYIVSRQHQKLLFFFYRITHYFIKYITHKIKTLKIAKNHIKF
jgi:hypothetical protein